MTPLNVLAVVSEIFPLIKTGGLADVAGALPVALAAEGVAVRSLVPGYPAVLRALDGGVVVAMLDHLFGGAARIVAAQAQRAWICSSSTRRISTRATAIRIARRTAMTGPTTRSASPHLSRVAALLAQGLVDGLPARRACTRTTGRPASRRPICTMPARTAPPTVMTVHNLAFQGQFPAVSAGGASACRPRPSRSTASSITALSAT